MATPTFKNGERSGKYRSFQSYYCTIKLGKMGVGYVSGSVSKDGQKSYVIGLHVKDATSKGGWRNACVKGSFPDTKQGFDDAKRFVKANWKAIEARFDLVPQVLEE